MDYSDAFLIISTCAALCLVCMIVLVFTVMKYRAQLKETKRLQELIKITRAEIDYLTKATTRHE